MERSRIERNERRISGRSVLEIAAIIVGLFIFSIIFSFFGYPILSHLTRSIHDSVSIESIVFGCLIGYAMGVIAGLIIRAE